MKSNLEKQNYKDNIKTENQEQPDLFDKNQIEKDIKDAYLEDIDFQLELEEQLFEEFSKTKNINLKETLNELRHSGEELLKKTSSKIIEIFNSNKLAVTLRDKYIEKRGNKIYKELSVDNKLSSVDDYDSFLKTLSSDFWGSSKNSDEALIGANKALTSIAAKFIQKSNFLEDSDNWSDEYWHGARDVLSVWPKLLSKDDPNKIIKDGLGSYLDRLVSGLGYYSDESKELTAKYIESNNDFIALKALSSLSLDTQEADFPGETLLRIDSLINKFPDSKNLPDNIKNLLIDFADSKPEEFLSDSRRTDFIFNLWLNDLKRYPDYKFRNIMPLFINRIANCSEDETKQILAVLNKNWARSHSGFSDDFAWILNVLPVDKKDLKPFVEKTESGLSGGYLVALKEAELSGVKITDKDFDDILNNIKSISAGEDLIFVSSLIIKYPNESLGMGPERIEQILDVLIERTSDRFDLENIQALNVLMNNNNWPINLKEKIFSLIKINNDLTSKILNEEESDDRYSWVKNEPLLWYQLQINFHEKAPAHELRHYFYEVLDDKKVSDNLDHLIKSYAASTNHLDFEELRVLFLDEKIDKKYIEYFIDKVYVNDILAGLENNSVNSENTQFILEATIKNGSLEGQIKALKKLFSLEPYQSPEKRQKMIELMPKNLINKINGKDISDWGLDGVAIDIFSDYDYKKTFLSDDEINNLGKGFLNESLSIRNDSKLTLLTLNYPDKIRNFFPDENENGESVSDREEYLTKLFERLMPNPTNRSYSIITRAYFSGLDLDIHNDEERLKIENKFLELRALNHTDFIDCFNDLNEEQAEKFLNYFEKNSSIDQNINQGVSDICSSLISRNDLGALKTVYLKLLNDKNLHSSQATMLFKEDIVFGDNDIRDAFFSNISNWPKVDGTAILEAAARRKSQDALNNKTGDSFSLNQEEIKKISTAIMNNRGLSPRFWKNYLNFGGENGDFYLDKNLFEIGIKNIGHDCFSEKAEEIVSFLTSIQDSEFEIEESDIDNIVTNSFQESNDYNQIERLQVFYQYKPELIEKNIIENYYFYKTFNNIFNANINYSSSFKEMAIEYLFKSKRNQYDIFLNYLSKNNDQESVEKFKDYLEKCDDPSSKFSARLSMLKYDLLSVTESKQLYSEITSSSKDNVRTQILNSIDVISSMLSNRNNIDNLEKFLDNPRPEHIEGLREMSDFMEKYSKENKGRSIVVMLFAREYLPDRKIEDVIEKVSGSLRKYSEIIDKNSYKNIPEGIRASIGMEYEITSSTADGYQKLTEQASLKNDIARLSKAARIGSGKDAVHEIATRPTDNPYLMLLEMKLLHDIEYIDFNFSRSEEYQKGARGFHLTIGGENGLSVNQETNFLQNAILVASWGGVQSGESGHKVNGGRGVSLRGRSADGANNNVQFFEKPSESVELRSLSIDKQETFQRAVTTAFNGAIAIQAFKECFPEGSEKALKTIEDNNEEEKIRNIINSKPEKIAQIANIWLDLVIKINKAAKDHDSFLDRETYGYLDDKNIWVDTADFGGEYNKKRFQSIVENIDPTLSVEEYVETTKIKDTELFRSFSVDLSDKLIKINNLYLKPGTSSINKEGKESRVFKGDHANASSMLKVTKLDNDSLEYYGEDFLDSTIFDMAGEKRIGYYTLQGGSELMITHAAQKALLEFNTRIEKIVN